MHPKPITNALLVFVLLFAVTEALGHVTSAYTLPSVAAADALRIHRLLPRCTYFFSAERLFYRLGAIK